MPTLLEMGSELENGHGILWELVLKTGMGKVGISEGMHFLSVGTTDQGASMAAHALGQEGGLLLQAVQNCSLHCHDILAHVESEARSKREFLIT